MNSRPIKAVHRGFTLLEVMMAGALLSIVTAGAMAAFIAQSRAINTQRQTSEGNDSAREAARLIGNDLRTAAAGVNPGSGGIGTCAQGSIPFDGNPGVICLPPVFRSNTPLTLPTATGYTDCPSGCPQPATNPCYNLDFGNGVTVPPLPARFCPDDLVVVAVDDTNPLFMVQSSANFPSVANATPITFAGTSPIPRTPAPGVSAPSAGYGFDDSVPTNGLMLYGGANGAVLMNTTYQGPGAAWIANGACTTPAGGTCDVASYLLVPSTPTVDLIRNNLGFGAIAMPAHIYRYSIEPVDAAGLPSLCTVGDPCVGANLIRSQITPLNGVTLAGAETLAFTTVSSAVLVEGVVDLQVEFGLAYPQTTGTPNGQFVYVNSGGLQQTPWLTPTVPSTQPGPATTTSASNCTGAATDPTVWSGVCFPTGGTAGTNALSSLRTVRLNLTTRSGANVNARSGSAAQTALAVGAMPLLQPAVQDLLTGNAEAGEWGFAGGGPFAGLPIKDGATYRQVSTEISIRNLGWTNNL